MFEGHHARTQPAGIRIANVFRLLQERYDLRLTVSDAEEDLRTAMAA